MLSTIWYYVLMVLKSCGTVAIILKTIGLGLTYGFIQGMIMVKKSDTAYVDGYEGGVRGHYLFNVYHLIFGIFLLAFMIWTIALTLLITTIPVLSAIRMSLSIIGLLLIAWQSSEIAYPFARWNSLKREGGLYEHLVLFDFYSKRLYGFDVIKLWFVRTATAILLIHFGGM